MALRAAKNLGCDVPADNIDLAVDYLKRCQDPATGGFRYMPGSRVTVPCTGTCILGLEICGKDKHHTPEALKAGGYLLKNAPRWGSAHFFYGVYYCSQAAFQLGGNYWADYRPKLHKELLDNQQRAGLWQGVDAEGKTYGPNYCTSMAILSLTVEYRYLPIYQRGEEPSENN
jgi:prenyltransferase beta subunit